MDSTEERARNYVDPSVSDDYDDGTMPGNVAELAERVVGHRIVKVGTGKVDVPSWPGASCTDQEEATLLTLDNGDTVWLANTDDCCAYTEAERIIVNLPQLDHVITSVTTSEGYTRWHIFADLAEVLELQVGWSAGNAFYYGYGFHIGVQSA